MESTSSTSTILYSSGSRMQRTVDLIDGVLSLLEECDDEVGEDCSITRPPTTTRLQ
jgi:hypothetical protein